MILLLDLIPRLLVWQNAPPNRNDTFIKHAPYIRCTKQAGMQVSLQLGVGERYSIISLLFFVPYIIFELPSNIVLKKVGTRHWLSGIVVGFGVV